MKCEVCRENLADYYFTELAADVARECRDHLHSCQGCWDEFLQVRQSLEFLDEGLNRVRPPTTLRSHIRRELKHQFGRSYKDLFSVRIPLYQVAALVVVFFISVAIWKSQADRDVRENRLVMVEEYYDSVDFELAGLF